MAPIEIKFSSPGWSSEGKPVNDTELVEEKGGAMGRDFHKNGKHFRVSCGTATAEGMSERHPLNRGGLDDGGIIRFWDESTVFEGTESKSLRRLRDIGNLERAHAHAEIGPGDSVKLTVDGENVAEIRHR